MNLCFRREQLKMLRSPLPLQVAQLFLYIAAKSVTLLATVLGDKLMPSNSFFWLGHKISRAFKQHSFMNKPSVKGRDDLAIISLIAKLTLTKFSFD